MALVLVVDDEPDIRELVRVNLEQAGHRVVTAADGAEALASVRKEAPDALFLDVRMPGTDGWAVLEELKAGSRRDLSEIPVIMVTAADEPEARLRGGIQGALQYITKPFDPLELVETLERTLSPSAPTEREQRRKVQAESLEALARYEKTGALPDGGSAEPRVRITRLEHSPTSPSPAPRIRAARERVGDLTPKQRQLLEALATRTPVTAVAQQLGISRSNVYASLRRIGRKLGLKGTNELLALLRQGVLLDARAGPTGPAALVRTAPPVQLEVPPEVTAPVVVGCSGGADSLALLALAVDAALAPVAVHVDHGLRPGSDREAAVVADAAARLGVRFDARRVKVAEGANLEARARTARYDALEAARVEHGATAVLVGHTADDQAETVLLNLLRGSGSAGLAGMPARRGHVVRPLLGSRRADARAECARRELVPVDDPSNDDLAFRRNWIRHEILPLLERGARRDLTPVLARQAEVLRTESDFLDELARAAWPGEAGTRARDLAALPDPLARRAVRCWLGPPPPSLDEVDAVLAVARGERRAVDLAGGRRVRRSGGVMHNERRA